jgi:hypothetical protein
LSLKSGFDKNSREERPQPISIKRLRAIDNVGHVLPDGKTLLTAAATADSTHTIGVIHIVALSGGRQTDANPNARGLGLIE